MEIVFMHVVGSLLCVVQFVSPDGEKRGGVRRTRSWCCSGLIRRLF